MNKTKFSAISDLIFLIATVFVFNFMLLIFYIHNFSLLILISTISTFLIVLTIRYFISIFTNKKLLNLKAIQDSNELANSFNFLSNKEQFNFVQKITNCKYSYLKNLKMLKNNSSAILIYNNEEMSDIDCINLIKNIKNYKKITIIAINLINLPKNINNFENIEVSIINRLDFYKICKTKNITLPPISKISTKKKNIKDFFKSILSYQHAKGFFLTSLIILFNSLFIPTKIYYRIVGFTILLLSIFCRFKKEKVGDATL